MSALDPQYVTPPALAERIALVRAQLAPIRSRSALLDSYRRESLCRLAGPAQATGSTADVLDQAYAMRWLELESDSSVAEPQLDPSFEQVDG
jgi:surfactin synthase thioesterase subunit